MLLGSGGQSLPTTFLLLRYAARFPGRAMFQHLDRGAAAPPATALRRYGVAAGSVTLALLLSLLARPLIEPNPFLLFFAAVALSAWFGGLGPGLAATGVAALLSDYFLLP